MEKLVVHGGFTLRGAVNISGSKNASLPILAASLLTDEPVVVRRVPDVSDTNFMVQIMGQLGASVERSSGNVRVEARNLHSEAAYEQVRKMRASICLMGPLMARMQRCVIPLPGGCVIGDRPVDLHIRAIQALGAQVQIERGNLVIEAPRGLKGATIDLRGDHGPTVLGTDNLMMAAVLALGWIGYQAGAATQTAGALTGIKALVVLIPAIFILGSWIAFRFVWNITPDVRAKMAAFKSGKETPAAE